MKHWKLFVGLVCILFIGLAIGVEAAPPIPATFWGYATSAGTPLSDGTVIKARIADTVFATTSVFTFDGQAGLYLLDIPGDDPGTPDVVEGGQAEQEVTFLVNGQVAIETAVWRSGAYEQQDLSIHPSAVTLVRQSVSTSKVSMRSLVIIAAVLLAAIGVGVLFKRKQLSRRVRAMKIKLFLLLFCLLVCMTQMAQAAPPIPHGSWGQVSADGILYADGTEVKAYINGVEVASTTIFTFGSDAGLYDINVSGDDPDTIDIVEGGVPGDTINFFVDGVTANETAAWTSGVYINLDLTVPATSTLAASFSATPASGSAPLDVSFLDTSTGDITSWAWDFGDGNSSAQQNPNHTYAVAGTYSVTLTVTDAGNSDTRVESDLIYVQEPASGPVLSLSSDAAVLPNRPASVSLAFAGNGYNIASSTFSIDYDEACLAFDSNDADADGVPDGLVLSLPVDFNASVTFDAADTDGEFDFFIADTSLPFAALPDGVMATFTFTGTCQPVIGSSYIAPVIFASVPPASFGDDNGQSVSGTTEDGQVEILSGTLGDCNADQVVDAGDISALALEIFDGDGNLAVNTLEGTFAGDPIGCDANEDTVVDAGDVSCIVLIIFNGTGACAPGLHTPEHTLTTSPAMVLADQVKASPGKPVVMPVEFMGYGHAISSLLFSIDIDETLLLFDATDADANGLPDAVAFNIPGSFNASVTYDMDDTDGELDFLIADIFPPISGLTDGIVVSLTLTTAAGVQTTSEAFVRFSQQPGVSFGNTGGQSVLGDLTDGSILIKPNPTNITGFSSSATTTNSNVLIIIAFVCLLMTGLVLIRWRAR